MGDRAWQAKNRLKIKMAKLQPQQPDDDDSTATIKVKMVQQQPDEPKTPNGKKIIDADQLSKMSDTELANIVKEAKSQETWDNMPEDLKDGNDMAQRFVYAAGINGKPQVMDTAQFNNYMKQNGLQPSDILTRSIADYQDWRTGKTVTVASMIEQYQNGDYTYIGGKHGGQVYGAGLYFTHVNGRSTGYGGSNATTLTAVVDPKRVRMITQYDLGIKAKKFGASHPAFVRAFGRYDGSGSGSNASVYALAMGYNAITETYNIQGRDEYLNVIDRSILIYKK